MANKNMGEGTSQQFVVNWVVSNIQFNELEKIRLRDTSNIYHNSPPILTLTSHNPATGEETGETLSILLTDTTTRELRDAFQQILNVYENNPLASGITPPAREAWHKRLHTYWAKHKIRRSISLGLVGIVGLGAAVMFLWGAIIMIIR